VQMRDRAWLARWIAEPEKVLRERDPIAIGLFAKYRNLPMPNMRLNKHEVDRLIDYVDEESHRVETVKRMEAIKATAAKGGLHSCCSKKDDRVKTDEDLVADAKEPQPPTAAVGEIPEPIARRSRLSVPFMAIFGVLGFAFLMLARMSRRI